MYEPYQNEMTKKEFSQILEILPNRYEALMYYGKKIKIFEPTYEEIRKKVIDEVNKRNYNKGMITREEFLELYELYKEFISQNQLADILGINIKYDGRKHKINLKKSGIDRVKYLLNFEERMYSKSELHEICRENEITLYDLLENIYKPYLNTKKYKIIEELLEREEIFIGRVKIPKEFQEKYSEKLLEMAKLKSKRYAFLFRQYNNCEDIASEALMYVLYNKGEIVMNTDNDEEALDRIGKYLNTCIKYKYLLDCKVRRNISLDEDVSKEIKRKRYEVIKSKQLYTEEESLDSDDIIIKEMQKLYDNGFNNTEAIDLIIQKHGLEKEELLDILKKELLQRRKIKKDKKGNVYLGESL